MMPTVASAGAKNAVNHKGTRVLNSWAPHRRERRTSAARVYAVMEDEREMRTRRGSASGTATNNTVIIEVATSSGAQRQPKYVNATKLTAAGESVHVSPENIGATGPLLYGLVDVTLKELSCRGSGGTGFGPHFGHCVVK